jgi:hypothetical protein
MASDLRSGESIRKITSYDLVEVAVLVPSSRLQFSANAVDRRQEGRDLCGLPEMRNRI